MLSPQAAEAARSISRSPRQSLRRELPAWPQNPARLAARGDRLSVRWLARPSPLRSCLARRG